jgi:CheY-like chemotaxis protein
LIIDDEEVVVRALTRVLRAKHDVQGVTRARDGLALLADGNDYDAILCDLMMPDMSGMEFTRRLETDWPQLRARLLLMTGGVFSQDARVFVDGLDRPPLDKPLEFTEIFAFIAEQVARRVSSSA